MEQISIVLPIKNEAPFLTTTFHSFLDLKPNEIIPIYDKCNDESRKIVENIASIRKYPNIKPIEAESSEEWMNRIAYLRRLGYSKATNDIILDLDADMLIDVKSIKKGLAKLNNGIALVTFGFLDYPWTPQCFLRTLYSTFVCIGGNLHAFKKEAWLKSEDPDEVKQIIKGQDTHLRRSISQHYATRHINTKTLHLRPSEGRRYDKRRGFTQATLGEKSAIKMFLHSLFMLRPHLLPTYLRTRRLQN